MSENALSSFSVDKDGRKAVLRIEADEGDIWELAATHKQVQQIFERIDDLLSDAR